MPKCNCGLPEYISDEWVTKRVHVPRVIRGKYTVKSMYYIAIVCTLHCEKCGNKRLSFTPYRWGSNGEIHAVFTHIQNDDRREMAEAIKSEVGKLIYPYQDNYNGDD